MVNFQQIIDGDSGLLVRAKLNSMLAALISGKDGIVAVWTLLKSLQKADQILEDKESEDFNALLSNIRDSNSYTDRLVSKIYSYIDAMEGGAGGLIDSPSYDPSGFPLDKAVTLIALGAGTYVNFKDVTGSPITITSSNVITIFFRPANVNYWTYQSKSLNALVDGIVAEALNILVENYNICQLSKNGINMAPITTSNAVVDPARKEVSSVLFNQYEAFMSNDNHKFYATKRYVAGDICVNNRMLYQFQYIHQGPWNPAHVEQMSILEYVEYLHGISITDATVELTVTPSVIYRGERLQSVDLVGVMYDGTPTMMRIVDEEEVEVATSVSSPITAHLSIETNELEKTWTLYGFTKGVMVRNTAKILARNPIYYGCGTTAQSIAVESNRYKATASAANYYESSTTGDGQHFFILVPMDIEDVYTFMMGGVPFVMRTEDMINVNGVSYRVHKSAVAYNSGVTLRVTAFN